MEYSPQQLEIIEKYKKLKAEAKKKYQSNYYFSKTKKKRRKQSEMNRLNLNTLPQ